MAQEPDFKQLGRLIEQRRKQLGLSPEKIARMGGPSAATVRNIEDGEPKRRRLETTYALEQILGWSPRSIDGFLDYGTQPHVVREPSPENAPDLADIPTEILQAELARRLRPPKQ